MNSNSNSNSNSTSNSSTLVIVESPAKCAKIEMYLGPGYKCIASFGHLREIKNGLKDIAVDRDFQPTYTECASKRAQISKIRQLVGVADTVLLASDDDREGEAIAWHICQVFGLPVETTKRIIFHEITEQALKAAVAAATYINMDIVQAQIARQVLDLIVGYKLSPLLWQNIPGKKPAETKSLSAGRCQTPALRLVADNQTEIEKFTAVLAYTTTGFFTSKNLPFVLNKQHTNADAMSEFLEESVNHAHIYHCLAEKTVSKAPPKPFTTSTVQQAANNELQVSPKETMQMCQKLYEAGLITYMRTDSTAYCPEFQAKARIYIADNYGREYSGEEAALEKNSKTVLTGKKFRIRGKEELKKTSAEIIAAKTQQTAKPAAHEAIRPTDLNCKELPAAGPASEYSPKERKMYQVIYNNTLASCMPPALYKSLAATISAPETALYNYTAEQVVFPGWQIVISGGYEKICKEFAFLQTFKPVGGGIEYKKLAAKAGMVGGKLHYSEARLIQLLEQEGIGRPSTFASLIDKIQERGYVKKGDLKGVKQTCLDFELEDENLSSTATTREFGAEKNKLLIQPVGKDVLAFLMTNFTALFEYTYTKSMEDALDLIAAGQKIWHELCREVHTEIEIMTAELPPALAIAVLTEPKQAPIKIDAEHTYLIGKYGPVIKYIKKGSELTLFKNLKPGLRVDIARLNAGEYTLAELIITDEEKAPGATVGGGGGGRVIGLFKDQPVVLKTGKYGPYLEYGNDPEKKKKSLNLPLKNGKSDLDDIVLMDVIDLLAEASTAASNDKGNTLVRKISEEMTIRKGQYGDYIMYKTKKMLRPNFLKLKGFSGDYKTGDLNVLKVWIKETYNV